MRSLFLTFTFCLTFLFSLQNVGAQAFFDYFDDYYDEGYVDFFDHPAYSPSSIFRYDTEVSGPKECTSQEKYDYWEGTCYFECFSGQDCESKINSVNRELDNLKDFDPNYSIKEGGDFISPDNFDVAYSVGYGEKITFRSGKDNASYRKLWESVSYIFPDDITNKYVSEFKLYSDDTSSAIAFVNSDPNKKGKFVVAINTPIYNSETNKERILTIVHELGHLVSLNQDQYDEVDDSDSCPRFLAYFQCFRDVSFLNKFVMEFWSQEDVDLAYSDASNLYESDNTKYVDEYAATNQDEDFAETFAYFVLGTENFSGLAAEKIKFFEEDEGLVELKNEIYNGVKRYVTEKNVVN